MTAFISIRVSTKEQARDGTSLPSQIRECLSYCDQAGITLSEFSNVGSPGIFADPGVSAWKIPIFERPGFTSLWRHVQPGDNIVFLSFDRAFRSTKDFLQSWEVFKSNKVTPVFVRNDIRMDTAAGQLWARTIASFSEYQSAVLSERVREANAIRKEYGLTKGQKFTSRRQTNTAVPESIRRLYRARDVDAPDSGQKGRIFAYARVSTMGQDAEPQIKKLDSGIKYRLLNGYSSGEIFIDDGVSAFFNNFNKRPAGSQIWSQLQRGDVIICTKLDRIFRSTLDMANALTILDGMGVTITTLDGSISTETLEGRAIASYLCIMAQWESQSISWRTKLAMDAIRQERGPWINLEALPQWIRRIKTGDNSHRLEVVPEIIRDAMTMQELIRTGLTLNEVSDVMQRQHEAEFDLPIQVPRSGFQSVVSIENILRSKKQFDKIPKVHKYCQRFNLKFSDEFDRYYSLQHGHMKVISDYANEDSFMSRYIEDNECDMSNIHQAIA